jgi:OFA family oxalate/formate antiporter-like MFS transporter
MTAASQTTVEHAASPSATSPVASVGEFVRPQSPRVPPSTRWIQLGLGIACLALVANLQYGWTLFVLPIQEKFGWTRSAIQVAFTIFVLVETWLVPVEGWLVDRYGPRRVVMVGGLLAAAAWGMNSFAQSLGAFYVAAVIGGIGAGAVYGTCIGNAVKWFPDKRGLATGLTAAAFGAGAALTVVPIARMIRESGFQRTFLVFGLLQGIGVVLLGMWLRHPRAREAPLARPRTRVSARDVLPKRALRTPIFWVMYVMFVAVAAGGVMAVAQLAPIARDFGIDDIPVTLLGITLPALTFALSLDRVLNGITRPLFGWISDHVGRENTMCVAFALEAVGVWALSRIGSDPTLFVLLSAAVFLFWGEIFSLFPATVGDVFGTKYATTNTGMMYTAKGMAALLVPFGNVLRDSTGSWQSVFTLIVALNVLASLLAVLVLRPMIRARSRAVMPRRATIVELVRKRIAL